jgi:hypothetical protein
VYLCISLCSYINLVTKEEVPEVGESLLMKRVMIKSEKEAKEPSQRKSLFRLYANQEESVARLSLTVVAQTIWFPLKW